jgi:hypothetical protein
MLGISRGAEKQLLSQEALSLLELQPVEGEVLFILGTEA